MPDRHEAAEQRTRTDPAIWLFLGFLAFYAAVIALVSGLTWKGLLHWTGELLLIIGISLAAKGISDVRREWTGRPGVWRSIQLKVQPIASSLWARWNQALEKRPRLAKRLHLRIHLTYVHSGDVMVFAETALAAAAAVQAAAITSGTTEARFAQLEKRMADQELQLSTLNTLFRKEIGDATDQERVERMAETRRIRESIADLAGGGLKLQAWGVACLLAGTIMTAIW